MTTTARVQGVGTRGMAASGVLWRLVAGFVTQPKKLSGAGRIGLLPLALWYAGLTLLSGAVIHLYPWVNVRYLLHDVAEIAILAGGLSLLARTPYLVALKVFGVLGLLLAAVDLGDALIRPLSLGFWPWLVLGAGVKAFYLPFGLPGLRRFPLPAWGLSAALFAAFLILGRVPWLPLL